MDMTKMAKIRPGIGVKEVMILVDYISFPNMAMKRFDQERGERLNKKRVVIPTDDTLTTRQDMSVPRSEAPAPKRQAAPATKVKSLTNPNWER